MSGGSGSPKAWRCNVAAVIMDAGGNVLLGRKTPKSRYLHFPQGGVRRKEGLEAALFREIGEEVGLPADSCHVLLRLAGLRYRYRSKNDKSAKWRGQEQTYFVLRCEGIMPGTDTSRSPEFSGAEWLPFRELRPELFVPFKRKAVARVLETLFPPDARDIEAHLASLAALDSIYYRPDAGLGSHRPDDRSFFAGGKAEVQTQMQDLARRIAKAQRRTKAAPRLLAILLGPHGSGRDNCLRCLALCMDPLATHWQTSAEKETLASLPFMDALCCMAPKPGESLIVSRSPYDLLLGLLMAGEEDEAMRHAEHLAVFEELLRKEGIGVLKFYLNISPQEQAERTGQAADAVAWQRERDAVERLMAATCQACPWRIIPSDRRWYRNYLIASLIAKTLEETPGDEA